MKKVLNVFLSICILMMCLPTNISVYAAETHETTLSSEAMNGIGGYSSDQGKSLNQFRVGGTEHGIVEAYNDASIHGGSNSKDLKVGFVRFDLGSDTDSVTKYELKFSGGWTQSNRWGNINLFVALADVNTTIADGETPMGDDWTKVTWNNRPQLSTELDSTTPSKVVKPKDDTTIDVSELLKGKTGKVTIAVLGEKATADGDNGEVGYGTVQLVKTSNEWKAPEVGVNIDFSDESVLAGWIIADSAQSRFGQDDTIGNYVVLDGAAAADAPRTADFPTVAQMIVDFDMMIPSKKADGTTDNTISGGNTGGIALMQGTTVAGVIGFRGDSKGNASTVISTGSTGTDYFNALGGGNANIDKDKWLHYTLIIDTVNKTGDIYTVDPANGKVNRFESKFTNYIKNITSLTNIGIVSNSGYSIAVANLNVKAANTSKVVISAEDNMTTQYIPGEGSASTVQYFSSAHYGLTYNSKGEVTSTNETAELKNKNITYSVTDSNGTEADTDKIIIDSDGLLSIYSTAIAGDYSVTASCENVSESMTLHVEGNAQADSVQVYGNEEIIIGDGAEHIYTAIPIASTGAVLPSKAVTWEIDGDTLGCSISNDGKLTIGNAVGKITVKTTITENGKSGMLDVYIRNSTDGDIGIEGILLNKGASFSEDNAISGIALNSKNEYESVLVNIKSLNKDNVVLDEKDYTVKNVQNNIQSVDFDEDAVLNKAAKIRVKIFDNNGTLISKKTDDISNGVYKNVPLVADWITGEKSGLGMGKGILSPKGAPCGVDPNIVDLSSSIKYETDANAPKPTADNVLWYKTGAYASGASIYARDGADWERQALPIGNGYMGGMLFGMPHKDQIQINEETFWAAGYRGVQNEVASNYDNPNMGETTNGYMSVGNIFVDFDNIPNNAQIKNYYRDLNLDDAVAHVQYEYDGVKYNREYFASYPKETLVFRYTADTDGALNFMVNPVSMHPGNVTVKDGEITIIGKLKDSEPYRGGGNAGWKQESDLEYCTKIKVIADDGTLTDGLNQVKVKGATGVTILVAAATDYDKDQFELKSDGTVNMDKTPYKSTQGVQAAIDKAAKRINGAAAMNYSDLKAEHLSDYHTQFNTVKFSLTDNEEICDTPTDELRKSYDNVISTTKNADGTTTVSYDETKYNNLNKHLEELHYNYARYMMISASRSNTMPANLQGKWCQSTAEIWGSCYCININMEMNYWFAGGANLLDSGKSLIYWFNSQIPAGRITAKNYYKVIPKSYKFENGTMTFTDSADDKDDVFIMHTKQAIMGTTDLTGGTGIQSPGNTAWLMYNLWDLYQTSGDKDLLEKELYPIMRKSANFYTQYLYKNQRKTTTDTEKYPDGYYYTTWSGRSPEQGPTQEGIKYDLQLVAGMYDYTIAAAETLGVDEDKVVAWKEIRNHLEMPVELGDDGQIKEWAQETHYNTDASGKNLGDPTHRHISHLVGLYPGTLINRNEPELLDGAKIVLQKRGDDSTGWSCSNKFLLWARTLEGDKALELFRYQLAKKTYSNLFDFHDPFQIDGNFGSAAGVMELLMQSQTGDIYILPALPKAWDKGEISGIKAKDGSEVSIKWSENEAKEFSIAPVKDGDIVIGYDKDNTAFTLNDEHIEFSDGLYTIKNAKAGEVYTFTTEDNAPVPEIVIEGNRVTVNGRQTGTLIIAGYDGSETMLKMNIIDGYEADLSEYQDCKTVKVFLWNSVEKMKPLCESKSVEIGL